MTNHPRRSRARLAEYGARLRTVDGVVLGAFLGLWRKQAMAQCREEYAR